MDAEEHHYKLRVDSFWSKVFEIKDDLGNKKYPRLASIIKCILTISHGNAGPERGFSINKTILQVHGSSLGEDTLVSIRRV